MTFQRMTVMTMPAIETTAIGYIIAPLICCCSLTDFSMYVARRLRMVSRIPPASPAAIMLQNSSSNTLGCLRMASARLAPPSMSWRVWFRTLAKNLLSLEPPRISRHCTRGSPASIMTENWRTKIARSFAVTLPLTFAFLGASSAIASPPPTLPYRRTGGRGRPC